MRAAKPRSRAGYSLVEVTVAMAIMVFGIVGVLQFITPSVRASSDAAMRGRAALLAQQKVEELRRDADKQATFIENIRNAAAPTAPLIFPEDDRLTYQFWGQSIASNGELNDPDAATGVARVIVRYNRAFRPGQDVVYELRFDR